MKDVILERISTFLDDKQSTSRARIGYIQLLSSLGSHKSCESARDEGILDQLARLATSDQVQDIRLEALNAISDITLKKRGRSYIAILSDRTLIIREADGGTISRTIESETFNHEIADSSQAGLRRGWIKFAGSQMTDSKLLALFCCQTSILPVRIASSPFFAILLEEVIVDTDISVRNEVIQALIPLVKSEDGRF
jgi:hypothetical protein